MMSDKELIDYILSHESFSTNLYYQNIINTLGYTPPIQNISIINKSSRIILHLGYSVTSENYALFKKALWFGEIKMKVYNGKVEAPFTFIASIRLEKKELGIQESFSDADTEKLSFYQQGNYIVSEEYGSQEDTSCKDNVSITTHMIDDIDSLYEKAENRRPIC